MLLLFIFLIIRILVSLFLIYFLYCFYSSLYKQKSNWIELLINWKYKKKPLGLFIYFILLTFSIILVINACWEFVFYICRMYYHNDINLISHLLPNGTNPIARNDGIEPVIANVQKRTNKTTLSSVFIGMVFYSVRHKIYLASLGNKLVHDNYNLTILDLKFISLNYIKTIFIAYNIGLLCSFFQEASPLTFHEKIKHVITDSQYTSGIDFYKQRHNINKMDILSKKITYLENKVNELNEKLKNQKRE